MLYCNSKTQWCYNMMLRSVAYALCAAVLTIAANVNGKICCKKLRFSELASEVERLVDEAVLRVNL